MRDAVVSARIPESLKESGNEVLRRYGLTQSQGILEFYRYLDANKKLPFEIGGAGIEMDWDRAVGLVDGLMRNSRFSTMSDEEIKAERIASRGLFDL